MSLLPRTVAMLTLGLLVSAATYEISEAARRGGFGGGRTMSRGGPAMGGSFHRPSNRSFDRGFNRGMNRDLGRGVNRNPGRDLNRGMGNDRGLGDSRNPGDRGSFGERSGDRQLSEEGQQRLSDRQNARQERRDQVGENRSERQQDRQDYLSERADDRQEFYNDNKEYYNDRQEWYEDAWRRGAFISATSWRTVGCANVVYVNGIRYYDCNGVRYEQVYHSGQVTYVIVN